MKKIFNLYTIIGLVLLLMFALIIVLLQLDKSIITESNKEVGLSTLNKKFLPNNTKASWDDFTDLILYLSLLGIFIFAVKGLLELFSTGSLFEVSKDIIVLGFAVVFMIIIWIAFDKVLIINYRPYNELEGSFPSTHILIVTFTAIYIPYYLIRTKESIWYTISIAVIGSISVLLTFIGRIKSGNHYFTDCLGGIVLALAIFFITAGITKFFDDKNETR